MFKIFVALFVLGGVAYGAIHFHLVKTPSLHLGSLVNKIAPQSAPAIKSLDELSLGSASGERAVAESTANPPLPGKVAGISTEKLDAVGQTISDKGSGIATALTALVTADGKKQEVTIDVQKISDQIGSQMEKLPAQLVEKAKVAYCQQVLIEATRSAEKK